MRTVRMMRVGRPSILHHLCRNDCGILTGQVRSLGSSSPCSGCRSTCPGDNSRQAGSEKDVEVLAARRQAIPSTAKLLRRHLERRTAIKVTPGSSPRSTSALCRPAPHNGASGINVFLQDRQQISGLSEGAARVPSLDPHACKRFGWRLIDRRCLPMLNPTRLICIDVQS